MRARPGITPGRPGTPGRARGHDPRRSASGRAAVAQGLWSTLSSWSWWRPSAPGRRRRPDTATRKCRRRPSRTPASESACCAEACRAGPGACAAVCCSALASGPSPGSPPSASEVASAVMAEPSVSAGCGAGRVTAWVRPWCFAADAAGPVGWVPLHSTAKSVTARASTRTAATMTRRRRARARRSRGFGAVEDRGTGHAGGGPTGSRDGGRDRALCTRGLWRGSGPAGRGAQRLPHFVRRREAVPRVRGHGATRHAAQRGWKPLHRGRSGTEALSRQCLDHDRTGRVQVRTGRSRESPPCARERGSPVSPERPPSSSCRRREERDEFGRRSSWRCRNR